METGKITEERRAEILRRVREDRERRRGELLPNQERSNTQDLSPNSIPSYPSYDVTKAEEVRKQIMSSILSNKFVSDSQKELHNANNFIIPHSQENHQQLHLNNGQYQSSNFGVDELIQERRNEISSNQQPISLSEIKQRLNEKLQRNEEIQQEFLQDLQEIQDKQRREVDHVTKSAISATPPILQAQLTIPKNPYHRIKPTLNQSPSSDFQESLNNRDITFKQTNSRIPIGFSARPPLPPSLSTQQHQFSDHLVSPPRFPWETEADLISTTERIPHQQEEMLYEKRRSHSYSQRRTEQEYIQSQKYPFKPDINEIPQAIYGDCDRLRISRTEQWERLLRDKIETLAARDNQKILEQQKEIASTCTFVPIINEISKQINSEKQMNERSSTADVVDRLYSEGLKKLQSREELKRKYEDSKQYPFKPDIQESSCVLKGNAAFSKPLYQRLDEVIQQKQEFKLNLQMQNQQDNQYTFKPILNPKSESIVKEKNEGKPVVQRLLEDIQEKEERRTKIIESHHQSISQLCPFQPSINPSNKEENSDLSKGSVLESGAQKQQDFIQRQYLMADYIKERLDAKIKEVYSTSEYSFYPRVNPISQYLVDADAERAAETTSDKLKRLCDQDQLKKQITQEQLTKAYYDKFSFQPQINPLSKRIARKRSLDSLAFDKEKNSKKRQLKEKVEGSRMQECSFQPSINKTKKFESVKSHYVLGSISQGLKEQQESKEKSLQQIKKQIEYEEMKECTFNPITKQIDAMDYEEKLSHMRGVDKFLKQKELSKKQIESLNKRKEEVFSVKDQSQFRDSNKTIPQPFNLSKGNGPTQKKLREELLRECLDQCTFQPETNEQKNKELIKRIISNTNQGEVDDYQHQEYVSENQFEAGSLENDENDGFYANGSSEQYKNNNNPQSYSNHEARKNAHYYPNSLQQKSY